MMRHGETMFKEYNIVKSYYDMDGNEYLCRSHVRRIRSSYVVTVPVLIAKDMDLKGGDAVQIRIRKIDEGFISEDNNGSP